MNLQDLEASTPIVESLTDTISSRVKQADELLNTDADAALNLASKELDEFPDRTIAAYIITKCFISLKRPGLAQAIGKQVVSQWPKQAGAWINLAQAFQLSYNLDAAKECIEKALTLKPIEADAFVALNNLALVYNNMGDPEMAMEYAHRSLDLRSDDVGVKETMGFAHLRLHKWTPGWHYYNYGLGMTTDRKVRNYNGAPVWNGERGAVVLYGEQGLGDEICFAQVVPQMIKDCDLIIDTCASLRVLFDYSFDCPVYGTRYVDELPWLDKVDACLSFGQAMEMYRGKNENFTGKPYLKADPDNWWKVILSHYPGRKVGIAWNAGIQETGKKNRTLSLEDVLLLNDGSTFVCLEYKNCPEDIKWLQDKGMNILDFGKFINGHKSYNDTAALVSELDHVIAPATTVVDLCGALGVSCDVLVPTIPHWRQHGRNVWYNSVKYIRQQGSWADTINSYMKGHHA